MSVPDADGIGWSYDIYRSHHGGTFICDVGGFKHESPNRRLAFFRYFRDKGFCIEVGSELIYLGEDAIRSMARISESRGGSGGGEGFDDE